MKRSVLFASVIITIFVGIDALNTCSIAEMTAAYNEMVRANCANCDKYFHCIGNYNAVYKCSGILQVATAEAMSNARELFGGNSGTTDSEADQAANRLGRSGGNCAETYLAAGNCAWNPSTKECTW
ncbi:hypothetical protein HA402_000088 [Bradysia odoriphaga]|nr:hypothetical protein HA402_000088 [Bradysia odoriphaga]